MNADFASRIEFKLMVVTTTGVVLGLLTFVAEQFLFGSLPVAPGGFLHKT